MLLIGGAILSVAVLMIFGQRVETMFTLAPVLVALLIALTLLAILAIRGEKRSTLLVVISFISMGAVSLWIGVFDIALAVAILISSFASIGLILMCEEGELRATIQRLAIILGVVLFVVLIMILGACNGAPPTEPVLEVEEYNAVLRQSASDPRVFEIVETWVVQQASDLQAVADWYDPVKPIFIESIHPEPEATVQFLATDQIEPITLPLTIMPSRQYTFILTRQLSSEKDGFLVSKCEFKPNKFNYEWSHGYENEWHEGLSSLLESRYAERTMVKVNLPKGSFYGASTGYDFSNYGTLDIATWELPNNALRQRVGFVYVDAPFHQWRWLVRPFIGISSSGEALSAALSVAAPACGGITIVAGIVALIERLKRYFTRG